MKWIPVGLGLLTSLLLWLAYFPVNCGPLGWVALVPLLLLSRMVVSNRCRYFSAWLSGLAFFIPAIAWMRVGDPMMYLAWIAAGFYLSLYFLLGILLIRIIDRNTALPLCASVPIVWTAVELVRDWVITGFPWYFLGHTQHDALSFIQIVDIGGVYALTFLVAAVNGLIADALTGQRRRLLAWSVAVGLMIAITVSYGAWRLSQNRFADGPLVALLQGNIAQSVKNDSFGDNGEAASQRMMDEYGKLMNEAMPFRPDLIVWPETTLPGTCAFAGTGATPADLGDEQANVEKTRTVLIEFGTSWQTHLLFGAITLDIGPGKLKIQHNSAFLVSPSGAISDRYHKIHCVPFGEFVPLVDIFPWMSMFSPYDGLDYTVAAGTSLTRFNIKARERQFEFGVLICYEDSDTSLSRGYMKNAPVDFLVNISNDGWFHGTQEHEQHLAISRFRAVECRRSLVRAVNMGISAIIDPNGRMIAMPKPSWRDSKAMSAVVCGNVPIDSRTSIYAQYGDWLPMGCWVFIAYAWVKGWSPWARISR